MTKREKQLYTKLFRRFCKEQGFYDKFCRVDNLSKHWTEEDGELRRAVAPFNTFNWSSTMEGYEYWYTRCLLFCDFMIDYALEHKGVFNLRELVLGAEYLLNSFATNDLFSLYKAIYSSHKKKTMELREVWWRT